MCEELIKFYQRESQADADQREMMRAGWVMVGYISWCHAARMWKAVFSRPNTITAEAERRAAA